MWDSFILATTRLRLCQAADSCHSRLPATGRERNLNGIATAGGDESAEYDQGSMAVTKRLAMSELDQHLKENEDSIKGDWVFVDGKIVGDSNCKRIEWLIHHSLQKVGVSIAAGGWETLYRDPEDGRYWEHTYPQSEMQGGGPPSLRVIASDRINDKYGSP